MGCVEVETGRSGDGYGHSRVVVGPYASYLLSAHRVSFEQNWGPIPDGMEVRHTCDNRGCVNPLHLQLGTHHQNMQDAVLRKRMPGRSRRTHCPQGHTIDGLRSDGRRFCKTCSRERDRRRQPRKARP